MIHTARQTQLCTQHIQKKKQFLQQAVRAGRDSILQDMESQHHDSLSEHVYCNGDVGFVLWV